MKSWFGRITEMSRKKAMPVLSFPSASLMGVSVKQLISDSSLQAEGMRAIANRCDTLASLSMMDLSVEAEAFGSTIRVDDHEVPTVYGSIVSTEEDVDNLAVPAVGAGRTGLYVDAIRRACGLIVDRPVFAGSIGPFSLSGRLMEMEEIMVNCYMEPDMVHKCLAKATQFLVDYCIAYRDAGADGIVMAEPAAGILSPALAEDFSNAYVKQIVDAVQTEEFAVIYHNCGNTLPMIDLIKEIGAYAYHFGNAVDMADILRAAPPDMVVLGNVDPSSQFRNGTPESVYAKTAEILAKCAAYPNFVISSGCDVPPSSPWGNIDAFFRAVEDFYT